MVGGVKGVMFCIGKTVGSVPHGREGGWKVRHFSIRKCSRIDQDCGGEDGGEKGKGDMDHAKMGHFQW